MPDIQIQEKQEQCDYLLLDYKWIPLIEKKRMHPQSIVERYTQLKGITYVDEIIPYRTEEDLEDILSMYHIDVRVLGEEYKRKTFTGRSICLKRGIELYYNKREHRFSTSDLSKRVCEDPN